MKEGMHQSENGASKNEGWVSPIVEEAGVLSQLSIPLLANLVRIESTRIFLVFFSIRLQE
jgi:hypothetical protein